MDATSIFRAVRHAPLLERADPLWDAARPAYDRFLRVLFGRRGITVRVGGDERIRVDPSCRWYEWHGDEFWHELMASVRPGDRFADVGSNIGTYAIAAARRGAQVTAFEPNPPVANQLRRNVVLNRVADRVTVYELAVARRAGTVRLREEGPGGCMTTVDEAGEIIVEAAPLEGRFDLVKIDVEGAELEVLAGARPILEPSHRPRSIYIEVHLDRVDPAELPSFLPWYELRRVAVRARTEHWIATATTSDAGDDQPHVSES